MKLAVVILNWNGAQLLEEFLPSVIKNSPEATIYVADNASTDNSVQFIQTNFPSVIIVQNTTNGGYAKGYNEALEHIEADIYCLLNSDVEVTKNWLTPILKEFEEYPNTAIIQPKILDYKQKTHFEYAGAAGGYIDKYGYPFCRGRIFDTLEEDQGQFDDRQEIFWASGACLFIRKPIFEEAGKFDEDYFAHQEEIDLCWRVSNLGYQTMYIGTSTVYHLGGATLNVMNPKKTKLNFRNSLYNLVKNVNGSQVLWIIFVRLVLDGIAGIKFVFEGKFSHFIAILQAHFDFYKNLRILVNKRKKRWATKKYYLISSVIIQYYIYKNIKFDQLPVDNH
ncbi:glycosyltransferase family 2 protein [Aquimarina brevivitae]|uniref:Glycosyltransferase 2-like domain-containing protein n=1 Tax=Aquimarina brevivitae TaxID=323412 RepID=A0A4Q7P257_9FLAO|nr:glycosyltransferase [Aquimarina brevivitae]RZS93966.1 hypothetical protein EV197_2548 [Aquimarina brevivitae]